jgi:hypothetical protein
MNVDNLPSSFFRAENQYLMPPDDEAGLIVSGRENRRSVRG